MKTQNIYRHMANKLPEMSKAFKKIAHYILENTTVVPFLNVAALAKKQMSAKQRLFDSPHSWVIPVIRRCKLICKIPFKSSLRQLKD